MLSRWEGDLGNLRIELIPLIHVRDRIKDADHELLEPQRIVITDNLLAHPITIDDSFL